MEETSQSKTASVASTISVNRRATIALLAIAVAFYWASLYVYVPTLGVYAENITGNLTLVGLILSMYGLWQAIVRLPLGIAADWLGKRKPFLIVGFALAALGAWIMGAATDGNGLLIGRSITGLAAATWVPLVVLFSSLYPAEQAVRATALLSIVNSSSRVLATAVTGSINNAYGYPMAFYVAVGIAGLAILTTLPVQETARPPIKPSFKQIGILIFRRDVLMPSLLNAVVQYISWATTFGFLPILAKNMGASSEAISILTSLNLFISMVGNFITSWLSRKVGNLRLVYISFAIMLVGIISAAFSPNLVTLYIAQGLIGFGFGICYPLLMGMSIEKVDETQRATAMGLHQAVYAIGMFAGPWLSGILADAYGIPQMMLITSAASIIFAIGMGQAMRSKKSA